MDPLEASGNGFDAVVAITCSTRHGRTMRFLVPALAALSLAVPNLALAQPADTPAIRDFDIETVETLGRAIYDMDRFAWVGTDALLEAVPQEQLAGMIGWIVVERDGAHIVRFGQGSPAAPVPFYDVTFRGDAEPVVAPGSGAFSDTERAMFRAVGLARGGVTQPCSNRYNSVILPDTDGDGWLVWMFAATTQQGVVPVGGHYRFTISADGQTIEQADRLSRSCLTMQRTPSAVGLGVSHIVSDRPVEAHVFLSLSHGLPLFVIIPDREMWQVNGDEITNEGAPPPRPQPASAS